MVKKIIEKLLGRDLLKAIIKQNKKLSNQNQELTWAHIYHDSIRDKNWMTHLSLNIGRMAGNYSFFYVLSRILNDYRPKDILEFGLGESSKMISSYLENSLLDSTHTIIEHDDIWKHNFEERFALSKRSSINILPLQEKSVKGFATKGYKEIEEFITKKYDLYIIDGPRGSKNYSRFDIVNIVKDFNNQDDFIIVLDDCHRFGEKQTLEVLVELLHQKGIEISVGFYRGQQSVAVIGSKKYQFVSSM